MTGTSIIKELRRSSLIILHKFVLTCCKAEFPFFLSLYMGFLPGIFTIYSIAGVRGGYVYISFVPLLLAFQTLRY